MKTVKFIKKLIVLLAVVLIIFQGIAFAQEVFTSKITYNLEFSAKEALQEITPVNIDFSDGQILDESSIALSATTGESIKTPEIILGNDGSSFIMMLEPTFTQANLVFSTTAIEGANETVTVRTDTNIISNTITISREILSAPQALQTPTTSETPTKEGANAQIDVKNTPAVVVQGEEVKQENSASTQAETAPSQSDLQEETRTREQIVVDTINYMDKDQVTKKNAYLALMIVGIVAVIVLGIFLISNAKKKPSGNKTKKSGCNLDFLKKKPKRENTIPSVINEEDISQRAGLSRAELRKEKPQESTKINEPIIKNDTRKSNAQEKAKSVEASQTALQEEQNSKENTQSRSTRAKRTQKIVVEELVPQEMEVYKTPHSYDMEEAEILKDFTKKIREIDFSISKEELLEVGEKIQKNSKKYLEMDRKSLAVIFTKKRLISDEEYNWIILCIKEFFSENIKDQTQENKRTSRTKK